MLEEVLLYLHNWFCVRKEFGTFRIESGYIDLPFLKDGQYFRILGSDFNEGVHQNPAIDLNDEVFCGAIWAMAIPPKLIELVAEIEDWQADNAESITSPFQSESFGGYSYSKASSSTSSSAVSSSVTWMDVYGTRLAGYRKI